jgi:hypothetical protein
MHTLAFVHALVAFSAQVMGVVYLPEIEDEIVRRRELSKPDSNFNRPS